MRVEDELKDLILKEYGSLSNFGSKIGINQSTLSGVIKRGVENSSMSTILKICKELAISVDGLAEGKISPQYWEEKEDD